MPGPATYLGEQLAQAVRDGELPEDAIDAKVRRLLDDDGGAGRARPARARGPTRRSIGPSIVSSYVKRHDPQSCSSRTDDAALPLDPDALARLAVIGPNADVAVVQGGGSAAVNPHHTVTILDGLRSRLGDVGRDHPRARCRQLPERPAARPALDAPHRPRPPRPWLHRRVLRRS